MDTKERIVRMEVLIKLQKSINKVIDDMWEDIKNDVEYTALRETIGNAAFDMVKSTNDMLKNIAGGNNGK